MTLIWGEKPPSAPVLRRLRLEDAPQAAELAKMGAGPHLATGWERLILWAGRGGFCLEQDGALLATALGIAYGPERGWIAAVNTHPDHRGRGYGRQVTEASLGFLQDQGVRRIMLDASELGRPLYESMGFQALYAVETWAGPASSYLGARVRRMRPADLPGIIALDARAFGAARGRVIRRLAADFPRLGWVDVQDGQVAGFLLVQHTGPDDTHLGPWVHVSPWGAETLLRSALSVLIGRQVRVDIPDRNSRATVFAHNYDLRYRRHCTRMIYGDTPPPDDIIHYQYGIASLATG